MSDGLIAKIRVSHVSKMRYRPAGSSSNLWLNTSHSEVFPTLELAVARARDRIAQKRKMAADLEDRMRTAEARIEALESGDV